MTLKIFFTTFLAIFLAELGDKTQLAILLMAADDGINKLVVFVGSSAALILATLIAVALGSQLNHWIPPKLLKAVTGLGFVAIGLVILWGVRT
ncbi:MAG: TMEM165/GDT1 family protein [Deltaproteobacteria bacterium]|nr:TMEM165/GDT1 family protein [Deltaproteobacteria bacterium]MBW1952223.1 TMEM165/GDT1 family protein [Deltaproteobacteria bacterium]MBW1985822.1 TMEM165/GDT1 family protein [Deltaproteobacteria bacterium]MBW2133860.1 TMEM165/GDT1 family protein [Deltaproteobacteria bacterium]